MDFTKYRDKLSSEEIAFFENTFHSPEIMENLKKNQKRYYLYISLFVFFIVILVSINFLAFSENASAIFIIFVIFLSLFFLIIFWYLMFSTEKRNIENRKYAQLILQKIFEKFSSTGKYEKLEEPTDSTSNVSISDIWIKVTWTIPLFRFEIGKFTIIGQEQSEFNKVYIGKSKMSSTKNFLDIMVYVEWKNFEKIFFQKKWENKHNFIAGIISLLILWGMMTFLFVQNTDRWQEILSEKVVLGILLLIITIIIRVAKEYKNIKKQNHSDNEFLKDFDIISEKPQAILSLDSRSFEHFKNLAKISNNNYIILFEEEKILFTRKIPNSPYFHNSLKSTKTIVSCYIQFYLEMKEILYILGKI